MSRCSRARGAEVITLASRHLRDDVQLLYDAVLLWNAHVLDKKSPDAEEVANGKN